MPFHTLRSWSSTTGRDETLNAIRTAAPEARVVESSENVGFGRACNAGAQAARGSHVLFLNQTSPLLPFGNGCSRSYSRLARSASSLPRWQGEATGGEPRGRGLASTSRNPRDASTPANGSAVPSGTEPPQQAWVSGAMLLVSREEFLELGGFDPRFFSITKISILASLP